MLAIRLVVVAPEASSMPPPAREALFPETVVPYDPSWAPSLTNTPPPEPEAPVALLPLMTVAPVRRRRPPSAKIAPPPWSASSPVATLPSRVTPETAISPAPFQRAPPSTARLPRKVEFRTETLLLPVAWKAPPLPGAASATLAVKALPEITDSVPAPEASSMAPPARTASLASKVELSTRSSAPSPAKMAPPEPIGSAAALAVKVARCT